MSRALGSYKCSQYLMGQFCRNIICDCVLGVLTKLDILDPGTDCREVLGDKLCVLKQGWTAVVNGGKESSSARVGYLLSLAP